MRAASLLAPLGLAALAGCAPIRPRDAAPPALAGCAVTPAPSAVAGRIAVVGDAQFNTLHASRRSLYRRRFADWITDVAIRPPALDATSHYLLRAILTRQIAAGAEVVFFLGDGANNGCQDELVGRREVDGIDGALTVLRQARARFGVPIFFVLGNHDYLGAGNTSWSLATRRALCNTSRRGDNAPLSKFAVMALVREFNRESAALATRWTYTDNWDGEALARACNGGARPGPRNQHLRRGCYLAAHLFDAATRREYLLVDSNDYADAPVSRLLAGRRGAVFFLPRRGAVPQTRWFADHARDDADLRVVLSHYDVATTNAAEPAAHRRLAELVREGRTVWLSAHTHDPAVRHHPHALRRRGPPRRFVETNVGSATDWPAYALVTDLADGPALARPTPVYAAAPGACTAVLAGLADAVAGGTYFAFRRHTRGLGLFGLDFLVDWTFARKEYRHRTWTREDDRHVRNNLSAWLDAHAPWTSGPARCGWPPPARLHAGACIGMYASLQEGVKHGWAPIACDDCRDEPDERPRAVDESPPGE